MPKDTGPSFTEQELNEIRRNVIKFSGIGLYRYRFDGTIVFMDEGALRILGLDGIYKDPSQVSGKNIESLIIYTGPRGFLRRQIREHGRVRGLVYPFRTLDGKDRWGINDAYLVRDDITGEESIQVIARDITEEKMAEIRLRETEAELRRLKADLEREVGKKASEIIVLNRQIEYILGATKTGLDIIDSNYNIRYIDPEWQKVYGDPKGKKCYEYFMGKCRPCPGCGITRAMGTKSSIVSEEILTKENNRPIQVTTIPFQDSDGEWLFAEVNVDITERKRAEKELLEAHEKLRRSEKLAAMGQLAGTIGHEFRNQLGIMRNAVYYLKMRSGGEDEKVRKYLNILDDEIMETYRIIENILAFARTKQPEFHKVVLKSLVMECIDKAGLPDDIDIFVKIDPRLPRLEADPRLLMRMLINVLSNSVHALGEQKDDIKLIEIAATHDAGYVIIRIKDTGCGIKEEDKKRIFEPLFTTKARGAGLGLLTTRILAEGHGGNIGIESEAGKGTTVIVKLPVRQKT